MDLQSLIAAFAAARTPRQYNRAKALVSRLDKPGVFALVDHMIDARRRVGGA